MIKERDIEVLQKANDPLEEAENLGYIVDKNLIIEFKKENIDTKVESDSSVQMQLPQDEAILRYLARIIKSKIWKLYGEDIPLLIAISHQYKNHPKGTGKSQEGYATKRIHVPKYMRKIIQGTYMFHCTSVEEIQNFELSDEDERIRRRFSDSTEE